MGELTFADKGTEDIRNGKNSKPARRTLKREHWRRAQRKLDMLQAAVDLDDLRFPPGNMLESLDGDRAGQWSVRINDKYRICFVWTDEKGAQDVEICDYH